MMQPALDRQRAVVLETSWLAQNVAELMITSSNIPSSRQRTSWLAQNVSELMTTSSAIPSFRQRTLTRLALSRSVCRVVCLSTVRDHLTVLAGAKQHLTADEISKIFDLHACWDKQTVYDEFPTKVYDWKYDQINRVENFILRSTDMANQGPGIGHWALRNVLLVGDQHGATKQPYTLELNAPFVSMSGSGCSDWLKQQLDEAQIDERKLYWVNAYDARGVSTNLGFIDLLKPKHIIALGGAAEHWCYQTNRPFHCVRHPQYHKRFCHKEPYHLIHLLKEYTL